MVEMVALSPAPAPARGLSQDQNLVMEDQIPHPARIPRAAAPPIARAHQLLPDRGQAQALIATATAVAMVMAMATAQGLARMEVPPYLPLDTQIAPLIHLDQAFPYSPPALATPFLCLRHLESSPRVQAPSQVQHPPIQRQLRLLPVNLNRKIKPHLPHIPAPHTQVLVLAIPQSSPQAQRIHQITPQVQELQLHQLLKTHSQDKLTQVASLPRYRSQGHRLRIAAYRLVMASVLLMRHQVHQALNQATHPAVTLHHTPQRQVVAIQA